MSGFSIVSTARQTLACLFTLHHSEITTTNPESMRCQRSLSLSFLLAVARATSKFGWRGVFDRGAQSHRVMHESANKKMKIKSKQMEKRKRKICMCMGYGGRASVSCRRSALHPMAECNKTDSAGL